MTTPQDKRLDEIERQLTPQEWAIRLADEIRKHPTVPDFMKSIIWGTYRNSPFMKPYWMLENQAEERHPGKNPEDIRARYQLHRKLRAEYHTLKMLIIKVNSKVEDKVETAGLNAALQLSRLHTLILQDAFARTAKKAAGWVEEYKPADADEEEARQVMLKELAVYQDQDVYLGETFADSLPLGPDLRIRFPTMVEIWVQKTMSLIADVFALDAAVRAIQDKYFDGHPILSKDLEAGLAGTIQVVEDDAARFNEYLATRAELFKAEWDEEEESQDGITSAIPGEREGLLTIDTHDIKRRAGRRLAAALADEWMKEVKRDAVADMLEESGEPGEVETHIWKHYREQYGVKP
jgi:hypothetical protein